MEDIQDDMQFISANKDESLEEDFKQISENLFGINNLKQKTDLSRKEIMGLLYLEMQNQSLKKELNLEPKDETILDIFINLYSEYKVSESRKGRHELVNSYIAKMERIREEKEITREII